MCTRSLLDPSRVAFFHVNPVDFNVELKAFVSANSGNADGPGLGPPACQFVASDLRAVTVEN